jgi:hypothetical protein
VIAPCNAPFFEKLGFITLAWMCMSSFLLIGTLLTLSIAGQREERARAGAMATGTVTGEPVVEREEAIP